MSYTLERIYYDYGENKFVLYFGENITEHTIPRNVFGARTVRFLNIFNYNVPPSETHVSYQDLWYTSCLFLVLPNTNKLIAMLGQCNCLWCIQYIQISSD